MQGTHRHATGMLAHCLVAAAAASFTGDAIADEWNYAARAGLSSVYDDNPTLAADEADTESTFRFLAFYEMDIETKSANRSFEISPRVSRDYYPDRDNSDLESTDYDIPGAYSYALPTARFNLGFRARQENVLSTEAIAESSAIATSADDTRTNYSITPSVVWSATEKDVFQVGAGYSKTDFDLDFTGRNDNETTSLNASYQRILSERQSIGVTGIVQSSESDGKRCSGYFFYIDTPPRPSAPPCDTEAATGQAPVFDSSGNIAGFFPVPSQNVLTKNSSDTDRYNVSLDYQWNFSQTLVLSISAGREKTKTTSKLVDLDGNTLIQDSRLVTDGTNIFLEDANFVESRKVDSENETYNIRLIKIAKNSEYSLGATRGTFLDTSRGTPQDRDEYRFDVETKWTEKLRSEINLQYFEQESVFLSADDDESDVDANTGGSSKTEFRSGKASLFYRLAPKWTLRGSYRYRKRERPEAFFVNGRFVSGVFEGSSNTFSLSVVYTFKKIPTR